MNIGSNDIVHMIELWECCGIGKTTISKAIHNSINDLFDGLYFLNDVRQNSRKYGKSLLQYLLLSHAIGWSNLLTCSVGMVSKKIFIEVYKNASLKYFKNISLN